MLTSAQLQQAIDESLAFPTHFAFVGAGKEAIKLLAEYMRDKYLYEIDDSPTPQSRAYPAIFTNITTDGAAFAAYELGAEIIWLYNADKESPKTLRIYEVLLRYSNDTKDADLIALMQTHLDSLLETFRASLR